MSGRYCVRFFTVVRPWVTILLDFSRSMCSACVMYGNRARTWVLESKKRGFRRKWGHAPVMSHARPGAIEPWNKTSTRLNCVVCLSAWSKQRAAVISCFGKYDLSTSLVNSVFTRCSAVAEGPRDAEGPARCRAYLGSFQFSGLSGLLNSIGSLCCGVRSKRDHSIMRCGVSSHFFNHLLLSSSSSSSSHYQILLKFLV